MISQQVMDFMGGSLCGLIALALFTIHIISDPKSRSWPGLPAWLRGSLYLTAWLFMLRSIGLTTSSTPWSGQHIPPFALLTTLSLCVTIGGLALYLVAQHFPAGVWERLAFVVKRQHENPSLVPAVLKPEDVAKAAKATGIIVIPDPDNRGAP